MTSLHWNFDRRFSSVNESPVAASVQPPVSNISKVTKEPAISIVILLLLTGEVTHEHTKSCSVCDRWMSVCV